MPERPLSATECLEVQCCALDRALRDLAEALDAVLDAVDAEAPEKELAKLEQRVARCIDRASERGDTVISEVQRQGVGPVELEAIRQRVAPGRLAALRLSRDPQSSSPTQVPSKSVWHTAADAGRADAQFVLACAYGGRFGHAADHPAAAEYARKAAEQGHASARFDLAAIYQSGHGVQRDPARALEHLRAAADAGSKQACHELALGILAGRVEGQPQQAVELLEKAAEDGWTESQLELGRLYAAGDLGEPDHASALRYLRLAAEQPAFAALEWLSKYENLTPDEYRNAAWLDGWDANAEIPPRRSGALGVLLSLAFLTLLIAASVKGNSLGLFLLILFVTVVAHEAGHLFCGRWVGIPTRVFCVGIGPLLKSFRGRRSRSTRYDVRVLPVLGYVEAYVAPRGVWTYWQARARAEEAGEPPPPIPEFDTSEEPRSVARFASGPRQLLYYLGGLIVNLLLAVVCLFVYENYTESGRAVTAPVVGRVPDGSIAATAGLKEGDRILAIDGRPIERGFFEARRRLTPLDNTGRLTRAPAQPPHSEVLLDIERGAARETLTWTTPAVAPGDDAEVRYGLLPPEGWQIDGVLPEVGGDLQPGDRILSFEVPSLDAASGEATTEPGDSPEPEPRRVAAAAPGAHRALRRAFSDGAGKAVALVVARDPAEPSPENVEEVLAVHVEPHSVAGSTEYSAPFELARLREQGPRTTLLQALVRTFEFGARVVVELPQDMMRSLRRNPTEEEKGRLLKAAQRDPWSVLRMFAILNTVLLVFNLLPIPPLDGFHVARVGIEMVIRRELPARAMSALMASGWLLLLGWLLVNGYLILRDLAGTVF